MIIEVLFFGPARETAGNDRVAVEVGERATVAEVRERLAARSESLKKLLTVARIARNREFVGDDAIVAPGDEIAVIPPVSGG